MVELRDDAAGLPIKFAVVAAHQRRSVVAIVAVHAELNAGPPLIFERVRRLAGDDVDRAAKRARPRQDRDIAFVHLNLCNVRGRKEAGVEPVVGGEIDTDAVDEERRLEAIKPANEKELLVARATCGAGFYACGEVESPGDGEG